MEKYLNSKIYKIEPINGEKGDIYIGSTSETLLKKRLASHITGFKRWKDGKRGKVSSFDLFEKYGVDKCTIVLIELINASSIYELKLKEAYYIKSLDCINKIIPLRSLKEYYQDNRIAYIEKVKIYN